MKNTKKVVRKRIMECITYPSANKYLPQPFEIGEKLIYLGEVEDKGTKPKSFYKQFIQIMRLKSKRKEVVARKHFKFLT